MRSNQTLSVPASRAAAPSGAISHSSSPPSSTGSPILWGPDALAAASFSSDDWLWHGYLARGAVTLLTSRWKAGKTTLVAVLLARMKTGGQLAGRAVAPGRAVVVSEEGPNHWQRRHRQLHFGDHIGWSCRPFTSRPRLDQWSDFIDRLIEDHVRQPFSLVVIDPLAAFLPGSENDAGSILNALLPLQRLTSRDIAVLVNHHPAKGRTRAGHAARGSGALSGFADILIEMHAFGKTDDRRRRLRAFSRFADTPHHLVIEWTADGADYLARGTFQEEEFTRNWETLRAAFDQAPLWQTRAEIAGRWPTDNPPHTSSLIRWLEQAVAQSLLRKHGKGLRNDPLHYWLPEQEETWRDDPVARWLMPEMFGTEEATCVPAARAPATAASLEQSFSEATAATISRETTASESAPPESSSHAPVPSPVAAQSAPQPSPSPSPSSAAPPAPAPAQKPSQQTPRLRPWPWSLQDEYEEAQRNGPS